MAASRAGGADEGESANGAGPAGGPGSGRWVEVAPDRIVRWVGSFADRHGPVTAEPSRTVLVLRGADGAVAGGHPPFPPMPAPPPGPSSPTLLPGRTAGHPP